MLLGLIRPTAGTPSCSAADAGGASATALPRVGALVEGPAFHPYLSGRANLRRLDAADRTADPRTARGPGRRRAGPGRAARRRRQAVPRLLAGHAAAARPRRALLAPRDLLILDEPTNGLDPQGTREVRHLITRLAADGTTVLLSTHLLSEVEQICTHVGVMHLGRLVAQAPLAELRGRRDRGCGCDTAPARGRPRPCCAASGLTEVLETATARRSPGCSATSRRRRSWPRWCATACRCAGSRSWRPTWRTCSSR